MMKSRFRFLLIIVVVLAIGLFAMQKALASPPPPIDVTGEPTTESAQYKLGGCITGDVKSFKDKIKMNVALLDGWNNYPTAGLPPMPDYYWTLPGGPADIFSCLVYIRLYDGDTLQKTLSADKGVAQVCLQTPPGKVGHVYFLDKFFEDKPVWVDVGGPFPGGTVACVPAPNSGIYAYYAPDPTGHPSTGGGSGTTEIFRKGSVGAPTGEIVVTKPGSMSLGGCATGNIKDLPNGDSLHAQMVSSWPGFPDLPKGVGDFYRCVVKVDFFIGGQKADQLPAQKGNITLCFAVPPQMNGSIYWLDTHTANSQWVLAAGPFPTGIACGPVDITGLYGMVYKKNQ